MLLIYSFILIIFSVLSLPYFFIKGKLHKGIFDRFFLLKKVKKSIFKDLNAKGIIWVHGASVGEISAVKPLIENLRREHPGYIFIFSTITITGNALARRIAKNNDRVIYFPFDLRFIAENFLNRLKPDLFIALETEIWPNFIAACKKRFIPVLMLNGRISERAFKRYLLVKALMRGVLDKIDLFCMQDESHKVKVIKLGAPEDKVFVTGNIKFDIAPDTSHDCGKLLMIKEYLNSERKQLFVAGSTHPGEESELLRIFKGLKSEFRNLLFLIAPRHIERSVRVKREAVSYGFNVELYSRLNAGAIVDLDIIILDVIGELRYIYELASVVFIGGSLIPHGGQNLIEPAYFSKPVLFGPYMDNFGGISRLFLNQKAAIQVRDADELLIEVTSLIKNPGRMQLLGKKAKETVDLNKGVTDRLMNFIAPYLKTKDLYEKGNPSLHFPRFYSGW
jgi:3-deoxy-D-manno-octulosonic-acid transferase